MGQPAFSLSVNFEAVTCYKCGVPFAAPGYFFTKRRDDHGGFWCPNGHNQHFTQETEAERLARELEAEKQRTRLALARENEQREAKMKLERKLKRVGRGTCPECNRSFQNLARHMNCKHGGTDGTFGKRKLP